VSDTVHDCWLPPPFAFFPFTSPPVRFRVPSHSISALPAVDDDAGKEDTAIRCGMTMDGDW